MQILHYPNPFLRKEATPVERITDETRDKVQKMFEIMRAEKGIGLAANQVGWDARITVINTSGQPENDLVLINPKIIEQSGTLREEEGCLSFPNLQLKIIRAAHIVVEAINLDNKTYRIEGSDLLSRALQHEIDHLNGVLFIDKVSPAQKIFLKNKLKQMELEYQNLHQ